MTGLIAGYAMPPKMASHGGETRRVGFELEFAGLEFRATVRVLEQVFQASAQIMSEAEAVIEAPELGKFVVEVDSELAKQLAKSRAEARAGRGKTDDPLAQWLVNLTTELVPVEVVCPPVAVDQLGSLDAMVRALRAAGAEGTAGSLVYAFGVHINPELPALDAATIARYLKAYVVAQDWLIRRHRVDMTRRFTPYIDVYPSAYCRRVVHYPADVKLETLLDDYLEFNATRNRALDLLPLFSELDAERVNQAVSDTRINARPTFHYRLPNCEIERGDWNLAESWNIWCVIEALAADVELLGKVSDEYRQHAAQLINFTRAPWHRTLDRILSDLVSA
jgi:hypothetical protein